MSSPQNPRAVRKLKHRRRTKEARLRRLAVAVATPATVPAAT